LATDTGKVIQAGENGSFGISITIQHSWGQSFYAHLKEAKVTPDPNKEIKAGELIALSGKSGTATGFHLHFGIKPNKPDAGNGYHGYVDPSPFLTRQVETKAEIKQKEAPVEKEPAKPAPVVAKQEIEKQVQEQLKDKLSQLRAKANEARKRRREENLNRIQEFVKNNGAVNNDNVRELLHVSQSTATNYLAELVKRGRLKKERERRWAKYLIA
jgi:type IV secretory pathway VirB10-like protein